ncbi:MAG: 3-carboxy-cis,cis-muconate cycloisomerase, partial [Hyphomicrobiales bacterium]|nr:3-carboxy-cis,cis-muconate cycloisomerase [Hyphomicrobiales bacterium]
MPSIVIGSQLWSDMFGSAAMQALFTDRAIVQRYLDVEAALARAQAGLGIIPAEAAVAITAAATVDEVDWTRLAERTRIVGY